MRSRSQIDNNNAHTLMGGQVAYLQGTTRWLLYVTPTIVTLATVCVMLWLDGDQAGGNLDIATVMMLITFINQVRFPMLLIPHAATLTFEGMVRFAFAMQGFGAISVQAYMHI